MVTDPLSPSIYLHSLLLFQMFTSIHMEKLLIANQFLPCPKSNNFDPADSLQCSMKPFNLLSDGLYCLRK